MSNSTKYNGWTNWETWLVNLWYGDYLSDIAEEEGYMDAEACKSCVEETAESVPNASLYTDFINSAMRCVDWEEIAEHVNEDL